MNQLEVIDDPTTEGLYAVEISRTPSIVHDLRMYAVLKWITGRWWESRLSSKTPLVPYTGAVLGWVGPFTYDQIELFNDPPSFGFYVVWNRPYPNSLPKFVTMEVAVWMPEDGQKRGRWWDSHGWNRHYGTVDGWSGPLPMLSRKPMWLGHLEAERIGL